MPQTKPRNRKPTDRDPGASTPHTRAHRDREKRNAALAARAARRPTFDHDPAVQLYRAEKKRAARRGCWLLQRREPVLETKPKRDQRANNAAYYERNKVILAEARAKCKANRAARTLSEFTHD